VSSIVSSPESRPALASTEPAKWVKFWRSCSSSGFLRNVVETYATRVVLLGITLITTIVVARLLGPEGRGVYAVAAAVGSLGVQFGNVGLHTANVYYAARDPETLPLLVGNTLLVGLGGGGVLALAASVLLLFAPTLISLRGSILVLALLWIPLGITYLLIQDLLLGVHDVRGYNLLEIVNKTVPLGLMVLIAASRLATVVSMFGTTIVAIAAGSVWGLLRLKGKCASRPAVSLQLFRASFEYALKAYLITLFAFLVFRADLFMVQHMLGAEQAGYYSIASSMADTVWLLAVVVGTILLPKLSATPDMRTKLQLTRRAVIGIMVSLFPLLLIASLLAGPAIRILFGSAFLPAQMAFVLLMPGMLFLGIETVALQFLNSIGCPVLVVWIMGTCVAFNFTANLWAIPHFGISGASVVSSVTYALATLCVLALVWRISREVTVIDPSTSAVSG
jgi:O-antigen/teichoic acid export membrane protein